MQESAQSKPVLPQLKPLGQHADKPPIAVHRPVFVIGSRKSAHLHLLSRQVDKAHALILKDAQGLYLRDLASQSHTLVNGQPVLEAWLHEGDQIKVGPFIFRVLAHGLDQGTPDPSPPGHLEIQGRGPLPLEHRVLLIGRRPECDVHVADPTVSSEHAVIFSTRGRWYLRDLGSRAGTLLNGQPVHQKELSAGDDIRIGTMEMRFIPSVIEPEPGHTSGVDELDQLVAAGLGEASQEAGETPSSDEPSEIAGGEDEPLALAPDEPAAPPPKPEVIPPTPQPHPPASQEETDLLEVSIAPKDDALTAFEPEEAAPEEEVPHDVSPAPSEPPAATDTEESKPADTNDLIHFEEDQPESLLVDDALDVRKPAPSATHVETSTSSEPDELPLDDLSFEEPDDIEPDDAEAPEVEVHAEPLPQHEWHQVTAEEPADIAPLAEPVAADPSIETQEPSSPDIQTTPIDLEPALEETPAIESPPEIVDEIPPDAPAEEPPLAASMEAEAEPVAVETESEHEPEPLNLLVPDHETEPLTPPAPEPPEIDLSQTDFDSPSHDALPLISEPLQESLAGEFDFSNLKLDLTEHEEPVRPESALNQEGESGLELLDLDVADDDESGDQFPAIATAHEEPADEPSLPPLAMLDDVLADSNIAPPASPEAEPVAASAVEPTVEPAVEIDDTRAAAPQVPETTQPPSGPMRGADGRFVKRPRKPKTSKTKASPKPAAETPPLILPPRPNIRPIHTPPISETIPESTDDTGTAISSLLGLGANQGGYFGGMPMGLETEELPHAAGAAKTAGMDEAAHDTQPDGASPETVSHAAPSRTSPIPPPFAQPTAAMQHPFDWSLDMVADADQALSARANARASGRRNTGFDALATPPVRQTDVFSQMPASAAAAALLNSNTVQDNIPTARAESFIPPLPQTVRPAADTPGFRPPPPPSSAPRRHLGLLLLLGLMIVCMILAAVGIWWFTSPRALIQGVVPFTGPQPTAYQQQQQLDLLKDPHTLQAARKILQDEHVDGGFLNDPQAYARFVSEAQWSADGLMLTRDGQNMQQDRARVSAVAAALYHSPANQAMIDQQANLRRQVEDLQSKEATAKGTLAAMDQQIRSMERNPPPVPTAEKMTEINQRLARLKEAIARGDKNVVLPSSQSGDFSMIPPIFRNYLIPAANSASGEAIDTQSAYLQTRMTQQTMESQLDAARQFENQLQDLRKQRQTAEAALHDVTAQRLDAQQKLAGSLAPAAPKPATAITLGDSRAMNIVAALGIIAIIFMFLMLLLLLVGRHSPDFANTPLAQNLPIDHAQA